MTNRYALMYIAWLAGVLTMCAIAVAWYRRVEEIGLRQVADRLRSRDNATDDTEDTDSIPDESAA